jgi:glucose-6-phosphate-specific signal transduction histidine kinase
MEERISALGGAFAIADGLASGTRLDITIPIEEAEPSASAPEDVRDGRQ